MIAWLIARPRVIIGAVLVALCWLLDQVDPGHCARCREDQP